MGNIYTGIDLGTDSIKIVVAEKIKNKFHVLASVNNKSLGIENGEIIDTRKAVYSVREALDKISDLLGIRINKTILAISPKNCSMDMSFAKDDVINSECITGQDISNVIKKAIKEKINDEIELVTAIPISFNIDNRENIKDPKGFSSNTLETKLVLSTVSKEPLYRILEVLKLSGIEVVDIAYTSTGDYFTIKNKKTDSSVGAIINIGETSSNISIFNKGIQIKNSTIPVGSRNVDKDIAYIFKISETDAKKVKENFAVSMEEYADANDYTEIELESGSKKQITQIGATKVVHARCEEILKMAKKEIKNLTNRQISYIIVSGGLSELSGFQYLVDEILGLKAKVCNINTIGIRNNKYSSVFGIIKYYDDKLSFREKDYNMISDYDVKTMISTDKKQINNENILGKMFGHFFDN